MRRSYETRGRVARARSVNFGWAPLVFSVALAVVFAGCDKDEAKERASGPAVHSQAPPTAIPEQFEGAYREVKKAAEARDLTRPVLRGAAKEGNGYAALREALGKLEGVQPDAFGRAFYERLEAGEAPSGPLASKIEDNSEALQAIRAALSYTKIVAPGTFEAGSTAGTIDMSSVIAASKLMAARASDSDPKACFGWAADAIRLAQDVARGQGFMGQLSLSAAAEPGMAAAMGCSKRASAEELASATEAWAALIRSHPSLADVFYWEWFYQLPRLGGVIGASGSSGTVSKEEATAMFRYKLDHLDELRDLTAKPPWEARPKVEAIVEGAPTPETGRTGDKMMLDRLGRRQIQTVRKLRRVAAGMRATAVRRRSGPSDDQQKTPAWREAVDARIYRDPADGEAFTYRWDPERRYFELRSDETGDTQSDSD